MKGSIFVFFVAMSLTTFAFIRAIGYIVSTAKRAEQSDLTILLQQLSMGGFSKNDSLFLLDWLIYLSKLGLRFTSFFGISWIPMISMNSEPNLSAINW